MLVAALWLGPAVLSGAVSAEEGPPAVGVIAGELWGGPGDPEGLAGSRPSAPARLTDAPAGSPAAALEGVTWKSAFEEREAGAHDSRTVVGWRAAASSPLWFGTLAGDVELLAVEGPDRNGFDSGSPRWLRLAVRESWGPVSVGVRFESASPGLGPVTAGRVKAEAEGGEAWIEGRQGPARLRLSATQFPGPGVTAADSAQRRDVALVHPLRLEPGRFVDVLVEQRSPGP
jgi:hypothetical protein